MILREIICRILYGPPPRKADFYLPSAEGRWGYPQPFAKRGGERAPSEPQISEEFWPDRIYLGGDKDRPWLTWWREPREFECRAYIPEPSQPLSDGDRERLKEIAEFVACVMAEPLGGEFPGHKGSSAFLRQLAERG